MEKRMETMTHFFLEAENDQTAGNMYNLGTKAWCMLGEWDNRARKSIVHGVGSHPQPSEQLTLKELILLWKKWQT